RVATGRVFSARGRRGGHTVFPLVPGARHSSGASSHREHRQDAPLEWRAPAYDCADENHQFRARSTALMAGVARRAAVMSARCLTSETSTSITMSKKSIERLTMRRLEMLPSWRGRTPGRVDRLPRWWCPGGL